MKVSDSQALLLALKTDFESFRAQRQRPTAFPGELRHATLSALASGVAPSLVSRATCLSRTHIAIWQKKAQAGRMSIGPKTPPRILDVLPSPPPGLPPGLHMSYEAGRLLLDFTF